MKKTLFIIAAIALAALAFTTTAQAQAYSAITLSIPSVIPANTSSNLASAPVIGALKQQNVAITMTTTSGGATGCTNTYTWSPSVDGVNYDTNTASAYYTTNIVVGAGPVTNVKNINVQGIGYLKLVNITSVGITSNNACGYGLKQNAP